MTRRYTYPAAATGAEMDPETMDFFSMVVGLASEHRFRGNTGDPTCTVLRHSMLCALIARLLGAGPEIVFYALVHDLHESITGDMPSPMKKQIPGWHWYEDHVQDRVLSRLGVAEPTADQQVLIRKIDQIALTCDILWSIKRHGNPTPLSAYTIDPDAIVAAKELFPCLR